MAPVVVIKDLVKEYPGRRALYGVSFEIDGGEIFGLVGPIGAGKTTAQDPGNNNQANIRNRGGLRQGCREGR